MDARRVVTCAAVCGLAACGGGSSGIAPVPTRPPALSAIRVSTDSFSDPLGQHATEVEPSMAAHGLAVVAAFQIARQFVAGASAVGVARSQDGGTTWTAQALPMLTKLTGGSADSASDPVVAYDTAHAVWLVATLPVSNGIVPAPEVSRSADGLQWDAPVRVGTGDVSDDKEWIACDGAPSSPHYGRCYVTWDDDGRGGLIETSVSSDGGVTWSAPRPSADSATGIGAQAVPRPNGDVAIVSDDFNEASVLAFVSRDGGSTWSASRRLSSIVDHFQGGGLRSGPLVSTAVDGGGTIYAVWQDCRYEAACFADDLVLATSTDGVTWSPPHRIPLDPIASGIDHFIPGLAAGPASSGSSARLALTYYAYQHAACGANCLLAAAVSTSPDGGTSWTAPVTLDAPMSPAWLARTTEGSMVADYVGTVFEKGAPLSIFASALVPSGLLDEATYVYALPSGMRAFERSARDERPVAGARSDHGPRRLRPDD